MCTVDRYWKGSPGLLPSFSPDSSYNDRRSATPEGGTRTLCVFIYMYSLLFILSYSLATRLSLLNLDRESARWGPIELGRFGSIGCTWGKTLARYKSRAMKWQSWWFCDVLPSYGKRWNLETKRFRNLGRSGFVYRLANSSSKHILTPYVSSSSSFVYIN